MIIIDGENAIYGRLCSLAAKKALEGNEVAIINSEKTIITGNQQNIISRKTELKAKGGHSQKGPRISILTYKMLKRSIRGMLPDHGGGIGKQALARVKCYNGVPKEFEGKETIKIKGTLHNKYMNLKELSKKI